MVQRMMFMQKSGRPIPWLSGGLATFVALFLVVVALPNTDKVVVDHSVSPARTLIQSQPALVRQILVMAFLPVLCIFTLGRRWIFFDWLAWIFLAFLLASVLMR